MTARPPFLKMRRRYEVDESYWLVRDSRSASCRVLFTLRRAALTFKWGRVPQTWELSFIDRMKELKEIGVTFDEVLRSTLPQIFGEDTSEVLRTWVGRKARCNPERFAKNISKMFGASARNVLGSVDSLVDEATLLRKKVPREPPIQSLLDAIRKADAVMSDMQSVSPTVALPLGREGLVQSTRATQSNGNNARRTA